MRTRAEIEEMIARIALKDRHAFSELYDATNGKLFGVVLRVLNNRAEAEDVLQEVYLRVWHKADRYAVTGHSPITWLVTVARNLAIDRLRAKQRQGNPRDESEMSDLADPGPSPEAQSIAASENARLNVCLDTLEPDRKDAVRGAYLEGHSYADLAEKFRVPLNTMRTWLRRSLISLRDCLNA